MAGGFFERLEQRMGGVAAEPVGGVDDDDAVGAFVGKAGDGLDEAAHLADADVTRIGVAFVGRFAGARAAEGIAGAEDDDIGMGAFGDQAALAALAAGQIGRIAWFGRREEFAEAALGRGCWRAA